MFNIQITNIQYRDNGNNGIRVYFNANDDAQTVTVNGYIPLTAEEYAGNESFPKLSTLVRQKLSEMVLDSE